MVTALGYNGYNAQSYNHNSLRCDTWMTFFFSHKGCIKLSSIDIKREILLEEERKIEEFFIKQQ